jgi:hopanoid biosynthesis associated RND transporter like protein HpnN
MQLSLLLAHLAASCRRHALPVVLGGILLAVVSAYWATGHLGVTTNTDDLFSPNLPWRQHLAEFNRDFPQFNNLLVAVIDAKVPEAADATAKELAKALSADHTHFLSVRRPDDSPFLRKEGLLFLDIPQLTDLLNRIIDAQPFIGQLVADPTARGLFSALGLLGLGVTQSGADLSPYSPALRAFHESLAAALNGHPTPLSWQQLLGGGGVSDLAGQYRFVLVQPRQDFGALQPGGAASQAMRAVIARLPFVATGQARVRITGQIALADEEFASVAEGAVEGLIGSVILITLWLFLAVRTWRLIVPILMTLGLGLMLTLLFASVAVGTLNLVSVGFGILFVGIAVDFAIQFSVRYRERRHQFADPAEAIRQTAGRAGVQILVASLATAAGFLAFVPTRFAGVAELGAIAGVGMLIAFICTLTFLPAAISLFRPAPEPAEVGFRWAAPLDDLLARRRGSVLGIFAALAVLAIAASPHLQFDANPLDTKNPNTEAMRTLRELMNSPLTNPYSINILAPTLADASTLAARIKPLSTVSQVITLDSFVPDEQQKKLALIQDANSILTPTLLAPSKVTPATPDQIRLAAKSALAQIEPAVAKLPSDAPLAAIRDDLRRVLTAPADILAGMEQSLTRFLPEQLDQLRTALSAGPVTAKDIPSDLSRDWLLPNGQARIQVMPKLTGNVSAGLRQFVDQVTRIAPDAGGSAVTIVATSKTIIESFQEAAVLAVVAIAAILFAVLRRVRDVLLVLAPLTLSSLLTLLVVVLLPLPLNYANIIALPLLLGVGVSFNIYFVMNWRLRQTVVLGSATARAILFSALTTGTAFGSLALSAHPGTASMGELLLISLGCTLVASLVFIPALLAAVPRPAPSKGVIDAAVE